MDHFNTEAPLHQTIRRLTQLRREYRVVSRGTPAVLRDNATGPGVPVYRMSDGRRDTWVAFNTALTGSLADNLDTGLLPVNCVVDVLDGARSTHTRSARHCGYGCLSGAKIYIPTWDYDGGFRALSPLASTGNFEGGQPGDALAMDDSPMIVIP